MAETPKHAQGFGLSILSNLGASLMISLATALWEHLRHGSVDWIGISALFILTGAVLFFLVKALRKSFVLPQQSPSTPAKTEDHLVALNIIDSVDIKILPMLTELQREAVNLSMTIIQFLEGLGTPPIPKYTWDEIVNMKEEQSVLSLHMNDVYYKEACEFHSSQRDPQINFVRSYYGGEIGRWFDRVRSEYALTSIGSQVEKLRHKFTVVGLNAETLTLPVDGRFGRENAYKISEALWGLAYKSRLKGKDET